MPVNVIQEHLDPRPLSTNVTATSGRVYRWGPDESQGENVPSGETITTRMPGGFATYDCKLTRRPDLSYADLDRFAPTTVTGVGGLVAFDGYLSARPSDRGDGYSFSPEAIGWSGHMKDDPSFSMIYIDRDMSRWGAPSATEVLRAVTSGNNWSSLTSEVQIDQSGKPGIYINQVGTISGFPLIELWYDAGPGNKVARVRSTNLASHGYTVPTDTNAPFRIYSSSKDNDNSQYQQEFLSNPSNGVAVSQIINGLAGTGGPTRYVMLHHTYNAAGPAGTAGTNYGWSATHVSVLGDHGLGGHGTGVDTSTDGYYGGDIIGDIISRAAPKLNYTTGATGSIVTNTFVVPHCVFINPTDADTAVQQVNQYFLNDYGVYENKTFFWRPPGTGRTWHLRLGDGVKLQDQGPQIETAYNGVIVQFTEPGGATRFVGPPATGLPDATSTMVSQDASSSALVDTSSSNPCNAYGRKRWATVTMGVTSTWGAVTVGNAFLKTLTSRPTTGTATVTGVAKDSNGREWPAWYIRSGDSVIFDDTNDTTARYVLQTNYSHDNLTNTLSLDAPPNKLDWLLQRLNLVLTSLG